MSQKVRPLCSHEADAQREEIGAVWLWVGRPVDFIPLGNLGGWLAWRCKSSSQSRGISLKAVWSCWRFPAHSSLCAGLSLSPVFHLLGCSCFKVPSIKVFTSSIQLLWDGWSSCPADWGKSLSLTALGPCTSHRAPDLTSLSCRCADQVCMGDGAFQLLSSPVGTTKCDIHT